MDLQRFSWKKYGVILLCAMFCSAVALAQDQLELSGTVIDAADVPVSGATVQIEGQPESGTVTGGDGKFKLMAPGDARLIISSVGFRSRTVDINHQQELVVRLEAGDTDLDEVVVVGYGTAKKVNLTGAVSAISGEDLAKRQVGQTSMALQGAAPGVTVTQGTGQPGYDGGTIRVRGIGTLNNSNPLVLVDGIAMSMNNVDPSSIESISVLKDAASSAIYGSRAANGVILITTKRGKSGKFSVVYDAYVGKQRPTRSAQKVDGLDHMTLLNEAYTNAGLSPLFSDDYIEDYTNGRETDPDHYPDVDWEDAVLNGDGIQHNHVVSVSGGNERVQFFGSMGYLNQNGLIDGVSFKRIFARLNTSLKLSDKFSGNVDIFLVNDERNSVAEKGFTGGAITASGIDLVFGMMDKLPAIQAIRYSNGLWGEGQNGVNPVAIVKDGGFWQQTRVPITANFSLTYQPFDFLTGKLSYSPTYSQPNIKSFVRVIKTYGPDGGLRFTLPALNTMDQSTSIDRTNQLEGTLNFARDYSRHHLGALAGYQYLTGSNEGFNAFRDGFLFEDYPVLSGGSSANMKNSGFASEWALISYFGRINYSFDNKYLFEANLRYDGSSRFATGNQWGTFPSFSAGWRISEEEFMAGLKEVVNELKIRGSWGRLGNQEIGSYYPFAPTVSTTPKYISNELIQNGAAITSLANTDISWETTTMTNIGLDARLWRHFSLTFDYYYKKTHGILLELSIPKILGVGAPYQNAGVVENRGWDLQLNYENYDHAFKYGATFSLSDVKNKVLDLKGIQQTGTVVAREGFPLNSLYLYKSMGLLSEADFNTDGTYKHALQFGKIAPGDIRYVNVVEDDLINGEDRQVVGSTIPRFTYSLNLNAAWKGFDFLAFLQGVGKRDGYLTGNAIQPFLLGGTIYEYQKDRWTIENPNPNALFPRLAFGESNNTQLSDFWMKSAAYLRVKNIQLGYTIPRKVLENLGVNSLRFYVSGENLFTFTKFWEGWDPEINAASNGAYYPQVKTLNIGINLKF